MKIEFRFSGAHQLILVPETGKDKQLLQLCFGERSHLRLVPHGDAETVVICAEPELKTNEIHS